MDETFGGGFDNTTTGGSGVQSEAKPQGITPLFIKHVLDAHEQDMELYGIRIGIVTFVALVRSIDHSSTKITYLLEDHTGQIEAHTWIEEGDTKAAPAIVINTYNRVYGSVRNRGSEKTLILFKLEPIETVNELITHRLEVVNARYQAEQFSKQTIGDYGSGFSVNGTGQAQAAASDAPVNPTGLTGKPLAVYKAIKSYSDERGIHVGMIKSRVPNTSDSELKNILHHLTIEGHIYSTIDSDHFLCCDDM